MSAASASAALDTTRPRAAAATEGARQLAQRFFDCLNRGDAQAALSLFEPEASFEIIPAAIKGVAAVQGRRFVDALLAAFPDLLIQVRSSMGTDELAVFEIKLEGTQARDFLGILNQEKHLDLDQAWRLSAARGRLTGARAYYCQNQLYRRLAVKRLDRVWILG